MTKPKSPRKTFTIRQEEINLLYEALFNLDTLILMDLYKPLSQGEVEGLYKILREIRRCVLTTGLRADKDGAHFVLNRKVYPTEP